jgi:universal stress protein E
VALDLTTKVKSKLKINTQLLEAASQQAQMIGGEIHLIYCIAISSFVEDFDIVDIGKRRREIKKQIQVQLDQFVECYGIDRKNIHIKSGEPHKVIDTLARKIKADITYMGAMGRRGVKGRLLGNTAEQMLQHLHTDLLLIRP